MSLLRAVRADLVEKRLWPVALLLLVALVAVPVLLGRPPAAPMPAPLPAPAAGAAPAPVPDTAPALQRTARPAAPRGRFKDPFRGTGDEGSAPGTPPVSPSGSAQTVPLDAASPPAVAGGASVGSPNGLGGSATGAGGSVPPGAQPVQVDPGPEPAPGPRDRAPTRDDRYFAGHRVDLAWGPAAAPRHRADVERLSVLEAAGAPEVVYMGVRPDGRTALFLLVADAAADGDGRCRPTVGLCHLLELRAGDTEYLDVPTAGGMRQYELRIDRVSERHARTSRAAANRRAERDETGRRLVRRTIRDGRTFVRRYVYSEVRGVLSFAEDALLKARTAAAGKGDLEAVGATPGQ